jgi:Rps23 Pro-64 3,4-dihydroxylase Tpa1-like proline 4-hydroxylase
MNQLLKDNNYIFLPNFIETNRAKELAKEFKEFCVKNNLNGDTQSPNSHSKYNFINFLELLCEKTPEVSDILGETVVPTYSYARVYKTGSVLEKHTDREACEVSLTVHLNGDDEWPIFIETPTGEAKSIIMKPGDAMLYFGCTAPHWRNQFHGNEYTQVFLHYVMSEGKNSFAYFDRFGDERGNKFHNRETPKINNEDKSTFVDYDEVEKKVLTQEKKSENTYSYNISSGNFNLIESKCETTLKEFIHVIDDVLPKDLCDKILKEYSNSSDWNNAQIGDKNNPVNTDVRNCKIISISSKDIIGKNYDYRKQLDSEIYDRVSYAVAKYSEIHPDFFIDVDTGYELLRYDEGNFYKKHTDSFKEQQRSISCSIHLNDDYYGGEFAFFDKDLIIRASAGSVVMFPSNFMFPHEIMPVTQGTRYSIITWLV